MKIEKNDLCPCGSGMNYRYCCLADKEPEDFAWHRNNVEQYSTERIISILQEMGVNIDQEDFQSKTQKFNSVSEMVDKWVTDYKTDSKEYNHDFHKFAIRVLWDRFDEDKQFQDKIQQKIEEGRQFAENNNYIENCDKWLEAWEDLKPYLKSKEYQDIRELDRELDTSSYFFNWCQELEMNLYEAGEQNQDYFEKRKQYCQEFLDILPESSDMIVKYMKKAEAISMFKLGQVETGNEKFQQLVDEYPGWVDSYLGWGDMYALEINNPRIARMIYEQAYHANLENRFDAIQKIDERISILEEE